MEIAILGLGCFWGPEIKFSKLDGIIKTEVGYCGGNNKQTTYKEVCSGTTNHAEVVKLNFFILLRSSKIGPWRIGVVWVMKTKKKFQYFFVCNNLRIKI